MIVGFAAGPVARSLFCLDPDMKIVGEGFRILRSSPPSPCPGLERGHRDDRPDPPESPAVGQNDNVAWRRYPRSTPRQQRRCPDHSPPSPTPSKGTAARVPVDVNKVN